MIRSVKELQGYAIHATDGDIGKADDFYFDDDAWAIRYLVVDAGNWLTDRHVLVSPIAVRTANWNDHRILVNLTREQIKSSPVVDTHRPISRQNEMRFYEYYGWPYYWAGLGLWGSGMYPSLMAELPPPVVTENQTSAQGPSEAKPRKESADSHLRSTDEVIGYRIHARDGEIGHITDFLIDDESWRIHYIVVDTSNWLPGRKVVIPPTWVKQVSWPDQEIVMDLARETIKNGPEFYPETATNRS